MKKLLLAVLAASTLAGAASAGTLTIANYGAYAVWADVRGRVGDINTTPGYAINAGQHLTVDSADGGPSEVRTLIFGEIGQRQRNFRVPSEGDYFVHFEGNIFNPTFREGFYQ